MNDEELEEFEHKDFYVCELEARSWGWPSRHRRRALT
jgi:hypothetical protein